MKKLLSFFTKKKDAPTILLDPFKQGNIDSITMRISKSYDGNECDFRGIVRFKNGDTYGRQNIKAQDLMGLITAIDEFIKSLEVEHGVQ